MSLRRVILLKDKNNKKALEHMRRLHAMPSFIEGVQEIRVKYEIIPNSEDALSLEFDAPIKIYDDIEILLAGIGYSNDWKFYCLSFICTNESIDGYNPDLPFLEIDESKDDFYLKINKSTTLKDIERVWSQIKKFTNEKNERTGQHKKHSRDGRIFDLANEGRSISEIYSIILDEYQEEIDFGTAKNIISRMQKNLKIPENKKIKGLKLRSV